jgi:hypothetical protein
LLYHVSSTDLKNNLSTENAVVDEKSIILPVNSRRNNCTVAQNALVIIKTVNWSRCKIFRQKFFKGEDFLQNVYVKIKDCLLLRNLTHFEVESCCFYKLLRLRLDEIRRGEHLFRMQGPDDLLGEQGVNLRV